MAGSKNFNAKPDFRQTWLRSGRCKTTPRLLSLRASWHQTTWPWNKKRRVLNRIHFFDRREKTVCCDIQLLQCLRHQNCAPLKPFRKRAWERRMLLIIFRLLSTCIRMAVKKVVKWQPISKRNCWHDYLFRIHRWIKRRQRKTTDTTRRAGMSFKSTCVIHFR